MIVSKQYKETTLYRYIKLPIRILARAKGIYVKSLTGCGPNLTYGNAMGCPTPQMPAITRSLSADPQRQFRAALIKKTTSGDGDQQPLQRWRSMPAGKVGSTPCNNVSSPLVVFGRIDEESCEVDGDGVGLLRRDRVSKWSKKIKG